MYVVAHEWGHFVKIIFYIIDRFQSQLEIDIVEKKVSIYIYFYTAALTLLMTDHSPQKLNYIFLKIFLLFHNGNKNIFYKTFLHCIPTHYTAVNKIWIRNLVSLELLLNYVHKEKGCIYTVYCR